MNEILEQFNDQNTQSTFTPEEVQKNNILAAVCYLVPILFFLPLLIDKNSSYCRFHANQALIWFVLDLILGVIIKVLGLIPILGAIINVIVSLAILAVAVCLMIGAYKGMAVRIPFIGSINLIN